VARIHAKVAQLVEHSTENAGVVGSIPSLGTKIVIHRKNGTMLREYSIENR